MARNAATLRCEMVVGGRIRNAPSTSENGESPFDHPQTTRASARAETETSFIGERSYQQKEVDRLLNDVYIVYMAALLGTFEQIVLLAVMTAGEEAYGRAVLRAVQAN